MPYEISYREKSGVVVIVNEGELTYDELVRQSQEAINLARDKKSELFLSDFSNVKVRTNNIELFRLLDIYAEFGMSQTSRIAAVVTNMELKAEQLRFFETICLNRGWQVKIFLKRELALEWLEKE